MRYDYATDPSCFGGSLLKGNNPKFRRPLASGRALHLILRASRHARGANSFLSSKNASTVRKILDRQAKRHQIRLYRFANSGNHLHLLVRARSRQHYCSFVRAITGLLARLILKTERGRARGEKFWDSRPFTRIVGFGRQFQIIAKYIEKNAFEAFGYIPKQPHCAMILGPPG